jgi:hypothetical protein
MPGPQNAVDQDGPASAAAEFSITRVIPLINKCSDYYASIVRFTIPLSLIPILIMPIIPGTDLFAPLPAVPRNITPFIIGIRFGGVTYTQNIATNNFGGAGTATDYSPNIVYDPVELFDEPPIFQTNPTTQIISGLYNYMYYYDTLINIVNVALAAAYVIFAAANPAAPQAIAAVAPFFFFDPTTQLISLITHNSWATTTAQAFPDAPGTARVCMNLQLSTFLEGFKAIFIPPPAIPVNPQNDMEIIVQNRGDNGYPTNTYPAISTFIFTRQDYPVVVSWSSLRKILITTNSIPIVTEAVPTGDRETGSASSMPIISDFVPQFAAAGDSRTVAYYAPDAQYRLADLMRDGPLTTIDLKIYWQDKDDNVYPLDIPYLNEASIKVGFFKKSLYKSAW